VSSSHFWIPIPIPISHSHSHSHFSSFPSPVGHLQFQVALKLLDNAEISIAIYTFACIHYNRRITFIRCQLLSIEKGARAIDRIKPNGFGFYPIRATALGEKKNTYP